VGDFEFDAPAVTHDHAVVTQTVSLITRRSLGPSLSVSGAKVRNPRRYQREVVTSEPKELHQQKEI